MDEIYYIIVIFDFRQRRKERPLNVRLLAAALPRKNPPARLRANLLRAAALAEVSRALNSLKATVAPTTTTTKKRKRSRATKATRVTKKWQATATRATEFNAKISTYIIVIITVPSFFL